jgi:hypothetical protein
MLDAVLEIARDKGYISSRGALKDTLINLVIKKYLKNAIESNK